MATDTQILENVKSALAECEPGDGALNGFFDFLAESERFLRFLHPALQNPETPLVNPDEGSREFGLVLYLLDNPSPQVKEWIESDELIKIVWETLKEAQKAGKLATSKLSPDDHELMLASPIIGPDGTIYGTATYEQLDLDPGWLLSALNYAINILIPGSIHRFETNPYCGTLTTTEKKGPLIAIIGDWGTGDYKTGPARQIMHEVRSLSPAPDYIIHLGDVYYAGTDRRPKPGEEQNNLLALWGDSPPETAFTLNSNHEMYGNASHLFGSSGIYDVALGKNTPFAHQNKTTYFALDFGPWVILGLDSAYYSDQANGLKFYMDGAIGNDSLDPEFRHDEQAEWIGKMDLSDKKIIVMTHHNPIDYTGDAASSKTLINQVKSALGRKPDFWYWGHVHIGAAYNKLAACQPTLGRCVGHSAIPFGIPTGLEGKNSHSYYSHTLNLDIPGGFRVLNGYMTIQLNANGEIEEKFYELGNSVPVWKEPPEHLVPPTEL